MQVITHSQGLINAIRHHKTKGHRIAFVPTMGNLHAGHLALVQAAKQQADVVVVSLFVNPTQFAAHEDLDRYPRTPEQDLSQLAELQVDLAFMPKAEELYEADSATWVQVEGLTQGFCGASRPGHFRGVTTVVNKLFNLVRPDVALFGNKDYQQLAVIRKMVSDLFMPIEIIGLPTVRATDGLALSSRNQYLSTEQRQLAPRLYQQLQASAQSWRQGQSPAQVSQAATQALSELGFKVDYFDLVCPERLQPLADNAQQAVILTAASLGTTKLLDNLLVNR